MLLVITADRILAILHYLLWQLAWVKVEVLDSPKPLFFTHPPEYSSRCFHNENLGLGMRQEQ